jgi:hypothetical protein
MSNLLEISEELKKELPDNFLTLLHKYHDLYCKTAIMGWITGKTDSMTGFIGWIKSLID